jgi:hypothetical protein
VATWTKDEEEELTDVGQAATRPRSRQLAAKARSLAKRPSFHLLHNHHPNTLSYLRDG